MKKFLPLFLFPSLFAVAFLAVSQDEENQPVELVVLNEQTINQYLPRGKEVDAIYGDVVLRNKHLVAVIAQPLPTRHANMTVRDVGGALIDLTSRKSQSDQLSAYYPGRVNPPYRSWQASTRETSGLSITPELNVKGGQASVTVVSEGDAQQPRVETTYKLTTEARVLEVTTTWTNGTAEPVAVNVGDIVRIDGGKEDMVKSPNGVSGMYWVEDRYWQQAYGFRANGYRIQSNSDARRGDLSYLNDQEKDKITLAAGASVSVTREIACGPTRLDVAASFGQSDGQHYVPVDLLVLDSARGRVTDARLEISRGEELLGVAMARDGEVTLPLLPGRYEMKILTNGLEIHQRDLLVADALRQEESVVIDSYRPGTLKVTTFASSAPRIGIPCKVEIIGRDGTPTPDFGPESAEFAVKNLRYMAGSGMSQPLQPGKYSLIVSHGPEFSARFMDIEIKPGEVLEENIVLDRQVDTTGWVSSDFHSHSTPSGDNTSSQLGRVLNLVCEHIEFAPCTEHNRIDSYVPHIQGLRLEKEIATTTGMELTGSPLPLNHQNVFPLHHHPHHQDGGGPVTDPNPDVQVERIAKWDDGSEKLIQQNHPDIGWLTYDRNADGTPDQGHSQVMGLIDVIEIHPVDRLVDLVSEAGLTAGNVQGNVVFRWLQLLNQGYRIPGVVNTDAHYNFHGSGWLRNWIQSSTDEPEKIDTHEMMHAAEEGRLVMSNAPFLEVWGSAGGERVTVGQDLAAPSKKVNLQIKVQCADWFDIDTVFVLANGKIVPEHLYRRATHADKFGAGPVKFEQTIELALKSDTHLIVCCCGANSTLGPVMGPTFSSRHPAALTNPIFVDVDGNGFTPNKDTLGLPLPVKGK